MRLCSFIFAFYILLLSAAPCCMADECMDEHVQAPAHSETDDCDDTKGADKNCHPFTICGSCSGFTITSVMHGIEKPVLLPDRYYTDFMQFYLPQIISGFWQPPKLPVGNC